MSDLKAEIEAIEYEHWMLQETGRLLRRRGLGHVESNAFIESHAIHIRNLIEFLFMKGDGLMLAGDACFGANWNERKPDGVGFLYGRASEEIAHLSRGRIENAKTSWEPELAAMVDQHFQRWLASTPEEVRQLFQEAQARHAALFQVAHATASATNSFTAVNTLSAQKFIGE